jgi:ethanolamine utilization protein EutN
MRSSDNEGGFMQLAKVIGRLVATRKYKGLEGIKFLIIQPIDKFQNPVGEPVVAADGTALAGPGDIVFFVGIREAAQALPEKFVPVDHAITGIVDEIDVPQVSGLKSQVSSLKSQVSD